MLDNNDTSIMDATTLRIRKVNRTERVLSGFWIADKGALEFKNDIGDEYKFVTYVFKNTGNSNKKMTYKVGPLPFCKFFDEEKFVINDLRKASNIPAKGTCPWPKFAGYSYKKAGNDYKRIPYKVGPSSFCDLVDKDKFFFEDIRKASNFPVKGTCPWPKVL
ncbi:unnamed protein product [Diamesa serratosioi]